MDKSASPPTKECEAQSTNMWNVVLWYFFEISYHFYNCIVNISVGPTLQLLSIYSGYENTVGVLATTVCNSLANCIALIVSPFVGGLSDYYSFRKGAVVICAVIYYFCFLIAGIFFHTFWLLCILFCVARTAFELVRLFYDCQIPYIMDQKTRTFGQGVGGAVSFTGAILAIAVSFCTTLLWGSYSNVNTLPPNTDPSFGPLQYLLFTNFFLGGFIFMPYIFSHEKSTPPAKRSLLEVVKIIMKELWSSIKSYFKDRDCVFMFISWCLMLSALSVVNGLFIILLGTMCGMDKIFTDVVFLMVNVMALLTGLPWALFLSKFGPKRAMQLMVIFLFIGMAFLVLTGMRVPPNYVLSKCFIIPAVLFLGPGLGVVYTSSRQLVMELSPVKQLAQFSAVTRIAARAGMIIMPNVFSLVVKSLNDKVFKDNKFKYNYTYRFAQIPVFVLLVLAFIFLCLIRNRHKEYVQGKRAPFTSTITQEIALVEEEKNVTKTEIHKHDDPERYEPLDFDTQLPNEEIEL
ncbi:hypothetical protein EIN_407830 [Entamoeba invadens IP1]|uniref:Major facilitator superfamily (MFS) profile domain-containing protein n=1 Tax=Entamoeba invadens IP1 TaxID=370355 RepID=A0A0A1TWI9_ENTIV|nr:hypothetical protein EIN_407830 [Entamoeba invadens IP1]ELP85564.1 hypothetical protein EIN_407830 [Entamoeba invadens IP1]|eukprot:XP_004184910.1 hypothetical protein EIN_407830 [Entamoeba invadens IP1]